VCHKVEEDATQKRRLRKANCKCSIATRIDTTPGKDGSHGMPPNLEKRARHREC